MDQNRPPSTPTAQIRPRARQRIRKELPPLEVPDINCNAAERKRVLNVLAQRRYRERKKQNRTTGSVSAASSTSLDASSSPSASNPRRDPEQTQTSTSDGELNIISPTPDVPSIAAPEFIGVQLDANLYEACLQPDFGLSDDSVPLGACLGGPWMSDVTLDGVPSPRLITETALNRDVADSNGIGGSSTTSLPLGIGVSLAPSTVLGMSSSSASSTTDTLPFPADSYLLPVAELTLIRAMLRIADRLGVTPAVWDITAVSPFYQSRASNGTIPSPHLLPPTPSPSSPHTCNPTPSPASTTSILPKNWEPTELQTLIPHHPALDLLPWPSARDRAIQIFSLPDAARPAQARGGPLGLVQFVYDVEDAAEGMRIYGGDPYDPAGWEVGQVLFERWWFVFDRTIVEQSNRWRRMRGATVLRIGPQPTQTQGQ